jgi:group I intron endonuclease
MKPNIVLKTRPLIYAIRNTINGKVYVGKTHCIYKRCHQYLHALKNNRRDHVNDYLYRSIQKHGLDKFEMFPLEFVESDQLPARELWWMNHLNTLNRRNGYNLRADSSSGMITHQSTRDKISERLKQEWKSGIRSGHSDKLKKSWNNQQRRDDQSRLFSKIKTKYVYMVVFPNGDVESDCDYQRLTELGLKSSLSSFHRSGDDTVVVKGHVVNRGFKNESQT